MRKKPDILLLLSVLVVCGVFISHYVVIGHSDNRGRSIGAYNASFQANDAKAELEPALKSRHATKFSSQELARIDSSKQQTR